MKKIFLIGSAFLIIAIAFQLVITAPAIATVYDYTGNPLNDTFNGWIPTSLFMTAQVTVDFSVPSNYTGDILSEHIVGLKLSVGSTTFDMSDPNFKPLYPTFTFHLTSGVVDAWQLGLATVDNLNIMQSVNDIYYGFNSAGQQIYDYRTYSPGTWTVEPDSSTVPEPCTMLLLGSGLVGIAVFRKRIAE